MTDPCSDTAAASTIISFTVTTGPERYHAHNAPVKLSAANTQLRCSGTGEAPGAAARTQHPDPKTNREKTPLHRGFSWEQYTMRLINGSNRTKASSARDALLVGSGRHASARAESSTS